MAEINILPMEIDKIRPEDDIKSLKKQYAYALWQVGHGCLCGRPHAIFVWVNMKDRKLMSTIGGGQFMQEEEKFKKVAKMMNGAVKATATICGYFNKENEMIFEICFDSKHHIVEIVKKIDKDGKPVLKGKELAVTPKFCIF